MRASHYKRKSTFLKRLEASRNKQHTQKQRGHLHRFADWINDWHVTRILQAFSSLTIFLFVLAQIWQFFVWNDESIARTEEREARALQVIGTKLPGESGKRWALEFLNKQGKDLIGVNVSKRFNEGKVVLNKIILRNAHLVDSDFSGAISDNSDFSYSDLESSDFSNTELNRSLFINTNMRHANFSDSNMVMSILINANLNNTDFSAANLSDSKLRGAVITNTNFKSTNLSGVDFSGAAVLDILVDENTNIENADLSKIKFPSFVYKSYEMQSDPTEPTPLEEAITLCKRLKLLKGAHTAKLPENMVEGFKCSF